jgi:hypothetical protein
MSLKLGSARVVTLRIKSQLRTPVKSVKIVTSYEKNNTKIKKDK